MSEKSLSEYPLDVGHSKEEAEFEDGILDTDAIEKGARATDGSVLPWYSNDIFEKSDSDFNYLKNTNGEKKIKSAIQKHYNRLEQLPKRNKMKYLVTDTTEISKSPVFSNYNIWHHRSVSVDRGVRKSLESVAGEVELEVREREKRFDGLHKTLGDQKYSIHDLDRQNKILNKKVTTLEEQLSEVESRCEDVRKAAVRIKKNNDQERKKTRKMIYSSCVAELNLRRDRANLLARPTGERVCIECCCDGRTCKDPNHCCYKCYFRDEVYVHDKRFRTETVYCCWKCKVRYPFDKPWYLNYRDDAYEMFRARTGFTKY